MEKIEIPKVQIRVTPLIYDTYQLLPEEEKLLKSGKAIYAFGEDPISGMEYESFLKMNPETGHIEVNHNIDVKQWMRDEWFKRHFPTNR